MNEHDGNAIQGIIWALFLSIPIYAVVLWAVWGR